MTTNDRRLIEDYLPLNDINAIASKEKKHPKHPVALIHYWPARRPTSASRAAVYAALVSAPNSDDERAEAASFVARLAAFNPDAEVLKEASKRVRKLHGGRAPKVLDMFAGGGAIPLEATRLGCESHAVEYNPVAHLIELCTLVYPQTFGTSLADDFQRWGDLVLERMQREIGDLYPSVQVPKSADVSRQARSSGAVIRNSTDRLSPSHTSGRVPSRAAAPAAPRRFRWFVRRGCGRSAGPWPRFRESRTDIDCAGTSCPGIPPVKSRNKRSKQGRDRPSA